MSKGSFQRFMRRLAKDWSERFPAVQKLSEKIDHLPASSTFYAGYSDVLRRHFYLNFQCSSKPWHKGVFTINVYGTETAGTIFYHHRLDLEQPGATRLGYVLAGKDKWWVLEPQEKMPPMGKMDWLAVSYADEKAVFESALADINGAICCFLDLAYPGRNKP